MKQLIFLFIMFFVSLSLKAQHPIDSTLKACMNEPFNQTTAGMIGCASKAYENWDTELNVVYNKFIDSLKSPKMELMLKESQRQWIMYRDKEFEFSDNFYLSQQGTMYRVMAISYKMEFVKQRAIELETMFESTYSEF